MVSPNRHIGRVVLKQSVLVNRNVVLSRDLAAPPVVAGNAVGVAGLDAAEEIAAHQVTAVVLLAESLQIAIGQRHRLEHSEQRLSPLHHLGRLCLGWMALTHQGRAHLTASLYFYLVANDQADGRDDDRHSDGNGEPEVAPGHMFPTASS